MTTQQAPLLNAPQLNLYELFAQYGPSTQSFYIDPEKSTVLKGNKGTRLLVPPFSLTSLSGKPAKGTVEIRLKEVFSQSDMVLAGRPTTSEDRLMESGGQILVSANQGHSPLKLSHPITTALPVSQKLQNPMAMRLFVGSTATFRPYSFGQGFDWKMASGKAVGIRKVEKQKHYQFPLQDLNWAGCEFFVARKSSRCMVTARLVSPVEQFDSLLGYLVFKDIHAVARMYPGKHNCTAVNIPEKLAATAYIIGFSKGKLYCGSGFLRRASDKLVNVKMRQVLEKELIETLKGI